MVVGRVLKEVYMFNLEVESDWGYESKIGEVEVFPRRLTEIFGDPIPNPGEPEKITGEYIFIAENGRRYSVHDYRDTNLLDDGVPSPQEFWNKEEPYEFSIGGDHPVDKDELEKFKKWLVDTLITKEKR